MCPDERYLGGTRQNRLLTVSTLKDLKPFAPIIRGLGKLGTSCGEYDSAGDEYRVPRVPWRSARVTQVLRQIDDGFAMKSRWRYRPRYALSHSNQLVSFGINVNIRWRRAPRRFLKLLNDVANDMSGVCKGRLRLCTTLRHRVAKSVVEYRVRERGRPGFAGGTDDAIEMSPS